MWANSIIINNSTSNNDSCSECTRRLNTDFQLLVVDALFSVADIASLPLHWCRLYVGLDPWGTRCDSGLGKDRSTVRGKYCRTFCAVFGDVIAYRLCCATPSPYGHRFVRSVISVAPGADRQADDVWRALLGLPEGCYG